MMTYTHALRLLTSSKTSASCIYGVVPGEAGQINSNPQESPSHSHARTRTQLRDMGLTKDQLRQRTKLLRLGARRGRLCSACVAFGTVLALVLGSLRLAYAPPYDPALDARCVKGLRSAQSEWFETRACAYDAREARADFVAAELALTVRAKHTPGPCAVLTLGLPTPSPGRFIGQGLLVDETATGGSSFPTGDEALARKMGFWMRSMMDAGAFTCETHTYTDERAVRVLESSLRKQGYFDAVVGKLWNDRKQAKQLDEEFEKIVKSSPNAKLTVLINDAKRSQSQFARFKKGLASGKVSTLIWRREITSTAQRKALMKEVKFVARFGYSVYLAGASQNAKGGAEPTAYLRIDHGAWDDKFATPNSGIELTIVAVPRDNKFKRLLDQSFSLCPVRSSVLNFNERADALCACETERFSTELAEPTCSLESRLALARSKRRGFWSFFMGKTTEPEDTEGFDELDVALNDVGGEDYEVNK